MSPEQPLSPNAVHTARPTLRIDGQENELVSGLLISLEMTESEGGLSNLEARFSNIASQAQGSAGYAFEDGAVLKLGAQITVYAGEVAAPVEIFRGVIYAIEGEYPEDGAPELVVLAEDAFMQARMARCTQVHEHATLANLVNTVASRVGLTPRVTGLTDDIGTQVQLNESDLAFLRRLCQRYDADLQVVGSELHASARSDVQRGTVTLALHSQLKRARVLADLAYQVTAVTTAGWDAIQGQNVTASSQGLSLGQGSGQNSSSWLSQLNILRSHHIGHLGINDQAEAQDIADAAFDDRARRFVTFEGTAEGNPNIRVGTQVVIDGLGQRFNNTYYVFHAVHRYDPQVGYQTDFIGRCAYLGR